MIKYTDIKDLIIYSDPIIGDVSLDFILTNLIEELNNQKLFENIVYSNLIHSELSEEDIASIFSLSSTSIIETYLKLIKDELCQWKDFSLANKPKNNYFCETQCGK